MTKHSPPGWSAVVVAWLALSVPAAAQVASVNGKIAYTACDYNPAVGQRTCDIWVMNPDGTGQTNLTNTPEASEEGPIWSPDGTRIAYVEGLTGGNMLMVMNADGTSQVAVTPTRSFQFGPTWSPGGTQLAFVRQVPGQTMSIQFDILVIGVDGTGERNLTNSDFDELDPAWSPDGTRIAFAGARPEMSVDPITGDPIQLVQWEIVVVNPDGSGEQILSAGDPGTPRATLLEEDRAPAWSPDSGTVVFMSQSVDPCCTPWQLWTVGRNGRGAAVLSDNPAVDDLWPSFSPDGTQIVFTSDRDAVSGGQFDVYTMPVPAASPAAAALATTTVAPAAATPAAAVTGATRLTTSGNTVDPSWGREPGTLPPQSFTLSVSVSRQGRRAAGVVASLPLGILCGPDCSQTYAAGKVVVLFAIPGLGSRFLGWSGACSGTTFYCRLTMDDVKAVGATFARVR